MPELFGRSGAVAVAALLLVPLAGLAARRRWAAYVVGGSVAVLVIGLTPWLFAPFSDLVSLSQSRRAAGFLPFAFAFAGGLAVASRLLRRWLLPVALAAGIVLQLAYPGDFDYVLTDGGPALATWVAAIGAPSRSCRPALAPRGSSGPRGARRGALPAAGGRARPLELVAERGAAAEPALRARRGAARPGARGAVVYSDLEASYRLAAAAPVFVAVAPPGHVADTVENRPYERREDFRRFARSGDLAVPASTARSGSSSIPRRYDVRPSLAVAFRDERWALYRLA